MPEFWGYQRFFSEPVLETCDGGSWPVDVMKEHDDIKFFVEAFNAPSREDAQTILEEHCKREGMINRVLHTSVDEGIRMGIRNIDDAEVLKECLKREQGGDAPRVTLVKALSARIRRLEKLGTAKSKQVKDTEGSPGKPLDLKQMKADGATQKEIIKAFQDSMPKGRPRLSFADARKILITNKLIMPKQAKEEAALEGVELVCVECGYEGTFVRPGRYEYCPICSAVLIKPGIIDSFSLDDDNE
jgi:rubrerythrin